MSDWFSDEELDRIARFAASPGHSRGPTMLLPEDNEEDAPDTTDVSEEDERIEE